MPLGGGSIYGIDTSIVPAAARTTTTTGEEVDLQGYEEVAIVVNTGTITDGTHTFSLTECATTGGSFTAVAAANIIPNATYGGTGASGCVLDTTSTHDTACIVFNYIGTLRYIKVVCTVSGTPGTGGVYSAAVVGTRKRHAT
jgi:hypothetical protein